MEKKPRVRLIGTDSNVFSIIGLCKIAAIKAGWTQERVATLTNQMLHSEDYDAVLALVNENFDVT